MNFPAIPGAPLPDNLINALPNYDFGPRVPVQRSFGSDLHSAARGARHHPDAGSQERTPTVTRLAGSPRFCTRRRSGRTWVGTLPRPVIPKGARAGFPAASFRSRKTAQQRLASGDPRPSLEERYGTHERYVEKVRDAAKRLVQERFLLQEDADRLVREAEASAVLR